MKSRFKLIASGAALLVATAAVAQGQPQPDIFQELLGSVFGTTPQASEQALERDWNEGQRPFERRRDQLEARIDAALRDGSIGRREADELRRDYYDIVRLEAQYSADGSFSPQQRSDLRARYRALAQRVDDPGDNRDRDGDGQRWQPLSMRNAGFEQRVNDGLRYRTLTQNDAYRLRADWRALAQVETMYQRGGIDSREEADLWSRYNDIDRRLGAAGFGGHGNPARWSQLANRLATHERNGTISRNSAEQLRAQLSDLTRLDAVYAVGGYNTDQRAYLARRHGEIDATLRNIRQ